MRQPPDPRPEKLPSKDAPAREEPGRTPQSAEGLDGEERTTPQEEPGPTPGTAEGEDFDESSRH